jgi:uncharacterized membrane protein
LASEPLPVSALKRSASLRRRADPAGDHDGVPPDPSAPALGTGRFFITLINRAGAAPGQLHRVPSGGRSRSAPLSGIGLLSAITKFRAIHWLQTSMWFWPLVCIGAGVALSVISVSVDRAFDGALIPRALTGGPDAALEILGTVAGSMVSLTGLVLTVVLVVVQLAMGQFSPRIVATILQDKPSQFAIGTFVGTFAHAMLSLSQVSTVEGAEFVPGVAIVLAFVLIIVSIMVLVLYVNHIGRKLRAASLIEAVGDQVREKLDELYPEPLTEEHEPPGVLCAPRSGVLLHIDHTHLVDLARRADVEFHVLPALGDFVPAGAPLVRIEGEPKLDVASEVLRRISLDTERSFNQDLAYGPRLLVDICVRTLAEPFDPTTAVQAIDRLHDFLRHLVNRRFPSGEHRDQDDTLRLVIKTVSWDDYVRLCFEEIRIGAAASVQVTRRLRACFEDLLQCAPEERRAPLERQLRLLDAEIDDTRVSSRDSAVWQQSDPQGIGASRAATVAQMPGR